MRQANKAIQRERHLTPTIKEIIKALNGATVFSKLDLNQGYNQLELTPESRYITTFSTHLGLRRHTRLNFGVSSAAEIFQNIICETLAGIPGAINLSDDILVFGKSQEEHDQALEATFKRLRESGLTLNWNKCGTSVSTTKQNLHSSDTYSQQMECHPTPVRYKRSSIWRPHPQFPKYEAC